MKTKVWQIDNASAENEKLKEASLMLHQGELVAFPTETVYGIGADAMNPEAIRKIFRAKGRPGDNPLIVHIYSQNQLGDLVRDIPAKAAVLMDRFWPGALTLILPKNDNVPPEVSGGLDTVAVRMPDHPIALALLEITKLALAAPSANTSGKPSPTSAEDVLEDLEGKIAGVIDGGKTKVGLESTVLDLSVDPPLILRPGAVTREMLVEVIGRVEILSKEDEQEIKDKPKSPGLKYRHYSPRAEMYIWYKPEERMLEFRGYLEKHCEQKIHLLLTKENMELFSEMAEIFPFLKLIELGSRAELEDVAGCIFSKLRQADRDQAELIICEAFPEQELGVAVMNRLQRAAGGKSWDV